ncbi:hypothetical protein [Microbacterium dauci]|uniref:Poxvirus protein I5 n=1 Tax=Microbacterium dauci TaxID=3048008 RepID=A0ABT6ZF87_9MICO|nr:hypothetical protein [Microbacterium sp. LX3-4]MDJ1114287.1 hypothetical protein [Microbacterium sp. LX3-4]
MAAIGNASRRAVRAAERDARSGAGPVRGDVPIARFPGATAKFALFGEVLLIGLLMTLTGLLVITLPAALAAGIRHLRRFVAADDSRVSLYWRDVRAGLLPGAVVGFVVLVATGILLLDIDLARSGFLPGGTIVEAVGWAGLAALGLGLLVAAGRWTPEAGWRRAIAGAPRAVAGDVVGSGFLLVAVGLVVLLTWVLPPLCIAAMGCAALAVVAVDARRR